MKNLFILLLAGSFAMQSQTMQQCRDRYNRYLNFKGKLNSVVHFEDNGVFIYSGGKKDLAVYADELAVMAQLFEFASLEDQMRFMKWKGTRHLNQKVKDSLQAGVNDDKAVIKKTDSLPLRGYRIAIDPGHFGTNMKDAMVEQKFVYFLKPAILGGGTDTVQLYESTLTYNTARIVESVLKERGADVFLTRERADYTSFNLTFSDWCKLHKKRTLDSLKKSGSMTPARYNQLIKANDYNFFWDFFRDYDLANRAKKVNDYDPHVTVIIHFNVDEKNAPWKNHSKKNFTMAFIGGAYIASNIDKLENKMHLLRMIVTDQLTRSEKLSGKTVENFHKALEVPIAKSNDALYLRDNCISVPTPGVFCRNLVLCRKINSPMVYGESLYQDNEKECLDLMKCDVDAYGVKTNQRIVKVASCYYEAVYDFLLNQ